MSKIKIEPMKEPNKLINYWKKEKFAVMCIIIFGLAYNISMVLGPVYQGKLIDSIADGTFEKVAFSALNFILIIAVIQAFRYFKRFYIRRFANRTSAVMRFMIYNNIMHETAEKLDEENVGNLMTRAVSDVEFCVEGMRKFTTEVFDTGVMMVAYFVSMLFYNVKLTLLSIVFIPAAMLLAEKLKVKIYKYSSEYRIKSSEVAEITYSNIENAMLFRISGMEETNRINYEKEINDLKNKTVKANLLENSMHPIYNVIAMAGIIIVIYMGGNLVIRGIWTIGTFTAYAAMFGDLAIKASKAAKLFNTVQKSRPSWNRIKDYLTEYKQDEKKLFTMEKNTSLNVDNLFFRYPGTEDNIIDNITFEGSQGQLIGITGPVACGKSTLGMAFLGLYPYGGSIMINGRELKDYSQHERSELISYLGHKPQLLSDTIYNNITLGNNKEVDEVLKDVCFDQDLSEMSDGQNTRVGNGGIRLSGGQQGRIALARTLLSKNKIIILDDPFSAVDMKTEEKIIENIKSRYRDSLIILISHRIAIFDKADKVLFMNKDKSYEFSTHEQMMTKVPVYREIYNLQSAAGDYNEKI
jgi:ABC-type multidrug transport system fused ATPase/permease subunit